MEEARRQEEIERQEAIKAAIARTQQDMASERAAAAVAEAERCTEEARQDAIHRSQREAEAARRERQFSQRPTFQSASSAPNSAAATSSDPTAGFSTGFNQPPVAAPPPARAPVERSGRAAWDRKIEESREAAEKKSRECFNKPEFRLDTAAATALRARVSDDPEFKQSVASWDDRRKRIEARLEGNNGTEHISALKMWFKHMQKHDMRKAVLALWEEPATFEARWDKLERQCKSAAACLSLSFGVWGVCSAALCSLKVVAIADALHKSRTNS